MLLLLILITLLPSMRANQEVSRITSKPQPIFIEQGATAQYLNFDFIVENLTNEKLVIESIEVSVFDGKDKLALRRFVDSNGTRPSIQIMPIESLKGIP